MCGITGQICFNNQINPEDIHSMNRALIHRGPDDEGFYFSKEKILPSVGLGHRRLSIIDLSSNGRQPMSNEDNTVWIVFNGEIYNFKSLREKLEKKGHFFKSNTDTEVILHLYEEYGTECLRFLRGMFALAIWDEKKKRLFAARDRVGKKPFYYAFENGRFYFASEINSLYEVGSLTKNIDFNALDYFLTFSYIPSPLSIIKEIKKLPPAHYLIVEKKNMSIYRYWKLDFIPKLDISFKEGKRLLLEKFEEATKIRLYSDVPLGCFLSGGIDSSLIVATMSKISNAEVKTFSIGFSDEAYDETGYARIVAERYKTEHKEFIVKPYAVEVLPELIEHYGEPFGDASALPTWYLSKLTRKDVKVVLTGDGGDELFAGYNWYATGMELARIKKFFPTDISRRLLQIVSPFNYSPISRKIYRFFELMGKNNAARFAALRSQLSSTIKASLYTDHFLKQLNYNSYSYITDFYDQATVKDDLDRMLYVDMMSYLPEELLVKVDRATMAHSLEARCPFLDHELIEFVSRLPSSFKYRKGKSKFILKETIKDLFPHGFLDRPKTGFSVPLGNWFRNDLRAYADKNICQGPLGDLSLFNMEKISNIIEENTNCKKDYGDLIWRFLVLSLWFKKFM